MTALKTLFNIEIGEETLVGLTFLQSVFIGFVRLFTVTAALALFLEKLSSDNLPYIYIATSCAFPIIGFLHLYFEKKISFIKLQSGTLQILVFALVGFLFLLWWVPDPKWLLLVLVIWARLQWVLTNIVFWSVTNHLFTVRQGKRLFGLIGTGEIIAMIVGGFLIPYLIPLISVYGLFLLSLISLLLALANLIYMSRAFEANFLEIRVALDHKIECRGTNESFWCLFQNRYVVLIFALVACFAYIVAYFTDNIFYYQLHQQYPDSEQLATFLGLFWSVFGFLSLIFRSFSGWWITRFGLLRSMLTTPLVLSICAILLITVGTLSPESMLLFWMVILLMQVERIFSGALSYPTYYILYQPLPANLRVRVQSAAEMIVGAGPGVLAGLLLLLLQKYFDFTSVGLSGIFLVVLLVWGIICVLTIQEYQKELTRSLKQKGIGKSVVGTGLQINDALSLQILEQGLNSHRSDEILYCLKLLEDIKHPRLKELLFKLAKHPEPNVRQGVYQAIEQLSSENFFDFLRQQLVVEKIPIVQGALLRALAASGENEAFDIIEPYLDNPQEDICPCALVGVIRYCGIEGAVRAGSTLMKLQKSSEVQERVLAAHILGRVGISSFYRGLLFLLVDDDIKVREAALMASRQLNNPKLWPLVVENLKFPKVREIAVKTLIKAKESALPALETAYNAQHQATQICREIIRIYGKMKSRNAITLLFKKLYEKDKNLLSEILWSLHLCGYRVSDKDKDFMDSLLKSEAAYCTHILATQKKLGITQEVSLLSSALDNELEKSRTRLFYFLSFIYPSEAIMKIWHNYFFHEVHHERDLAIELLENLVKTTHAFILPLLKVSFQGPRPCLKANITEQHIECIKEIIFQSDIWNNSWIRACVIDEAIDLSITDLHTYLLPLLNDQDELVKETAQYFLDQQLEKNLTYWPTIEKVKILQKVDIFSEIPDELLAEISVLLEEIDVDAGANIFRQGDLGTSLYIVANGLLRVHKEEDTLLELCKCSIFGEWAALDPEPRSSSVTALKKSHLFQLSQEELHTVMRNQVQVARGIMQHLYNRLRALERRRTSKPISVQSVQSEPTKKQLRRFSSIEPLSLIEKVIILKTVSIFANTPDHILSEIASLSREIWLEKDKVLFNKGDPTSMYIIVEGRVKVYNEKRVIVELGERETLGEFTTLFSESQTVSVAALDDTRLLSLTRDALFELMWDQYDIIKGIIHVLVQRLRQRG